MPPTMHGTLLLEPGGPGTLEHIEADLKAKVPLIGGKLEKAAASPIQEAIDIEADRPRVASRLTAPRHAGKGLEPQWFQALSRSQGGGADQPMCG